jgi:tRNA pseudouridine synthase 10
MFKRHSKVFQVAICDHCLGRQYAQLLSGYSNDQRGEILREGAAIAVDGGLVEDTELEPSNFSGFNFRQNKDFSKLVAKSKHKKCQVCDDFFANIIKFTEKIAKQLKKIEFSTFLIGTVPSRDLLEREEQMWEVLGIDFCEPIRAEINREVGKRLEKIVNKKAELKKPDITILVNLDKNKIEVKKNPLFVFGYYNKLKRGFPQCKWGTPKKYRTSIEQIVGKPILKATKGKDHKFHGAGREDIDAVCTGKRAFVLEIVDPNKRNIDLKKITKEIKKSKRVEVFNLKIANMDTVRKIKAARPSKTYHALVKLKKAITKADLKKLKKLNTTIKQRTPTRVKHRRADLMRKRKVLSLKTIYKNPKTFILEVKTDAGLYVKELVSGDEGRSVPSVRSLLGVPAVVKTLDVVKIDKIKL